jgi:hypothetical protein
LPPLFHQGGQDLGWFFDEWSCGSGMPAELEFIYADGSASRETVLVDKAVNRFRFNLERTPVSFVFDPDSRILCRAEGLKKKVKNGR